MGLLGSALKLTLKGAGSVITKVPRTLVTGGALVVVYDTLLPVAEDVWRDFPGDGTIVEKVARRIGEQAGKSAGGASTAATQGAAAAALSTVGVNTADPQVSALIKIGVLGVLALFVLQAIRR